MSLPIKISLPEHFLESEVRSGYEVSEKLKKIWAVELDLANELFRVCKKHGIRVMVFGGTLIGAVRHRGFIPWDDDFDLWIPREDYKKLLAVSDEFKHPYFLQHALSDRGYFIQYARLRNSRTTAAIIGQDACGYNNGIYIDIYVLDGYVDNLCLYRLHSGLIRIVTKLCSAYSESIAQGPSARKLSRIVYSVIKVLPFEFWNGLLTRVLSLFNNTAKRIGGRFWIHPSAYKYWTEKSAFDDLIELPFEHLMVPCSRQYDEMLKRIYGKYMEFPPVDERGKWHEGIIHFEPDIPYAEYLKGTCEGLRV